MPCAMLRFLSTSYYKEIQACCITTKLIQASSFANGRRGKSLSSFLGIHLLIGEHLPDPVACQDQKFVP